MRRHLFWKIYLTILASLVVVSLVIASVWRASGVSMAERWEATRTRFARELIPPIDAPAAEVQQAIGRLARALGGDVAVFGPNRRLIAASGQPIDYREDDETGPPPPRRLSRPMRVDLPDGRRVLARFELPLPDSGFRILFAVLLAAGGVGLAAYPVTALLTRRLERLRAGVERWGGGALAERVPVSGRDEVAQVAASFNVAAARVEALVNSQRALLANASHELRSPLARLRMGVELLREKPDQAAREAIGHELAEIDMLVEEILLASRLDHAGGKDRSGDSAVDLLGLAAEEAARTGADVSGEAIEIRGDATLLRRLIRNLLENARKHGAPPVEVIVSAQGAEARLTVLDRGAGIAESERLRVFEPFYRPEGRSESTGGWGLGLSLVRQIAERHGGTVLCTAREGGGTLFQVDLPPA